jgi:pyruvate,orthophosphate dikinase
MASEKKHIVLGVTGSIAAYKSADLVRRLMESGYRVSVVMTKEAEFFSFGTNDLTQTTFGLSRDDSSNFLGHYQKAGIFEKDPFAELDQDGVGELIKIATERGRKTRPELKLGICGEHGGNPNSIYFCHKTGLDYVSCSPYRVPIARLAAARATLI